MKFAPAVILTVPTSMFAFTTTLPWLETVSTVGGAEIGPSMSISGLAKLTPSKVLNARLNDPVVVAFWLSVIEEDELIWAIVVPAGMPAPGAATVSPTKKPAVFSPVTNSDPVVRLPVWEEPMFSGSFEE